MEQRKAMSDKYQSCNVEQVQNGTLRMTLDSFSPLKLLAAPNRSVLGVNKLATSQNVFKGYFQITNHGKQLLTYKIMTKVKAKLAVKPSSGFLTPGETTKLHVQIRNMHLDNNTVSKGMSILVIATSCKVILANCSINLHTFWKNLMQCGSTSFVEMLEVNKFQFYTQQGSPLVFQARANNHSRRLRETVGGSHRVSTNAINNNLVGQDDSGSSSSHLMLQTDSEERFPDEASGDCSSQSAASGTISDNHTYRKTKTIKTSGLESISKTLRLKLSTQQTQSHKSVGHFISYLLLFGFVLVLSFVFFGLLKVDLSIFNASDHLKDAGS